MAAINDLDIKPGDIYDVFLMAPANEKILMVCGPEFGHDAGRCWEERYYHLVNLWSKVCHHVEHV